MKSSTRIFDQKLGVDFLQSVPASPGVYRIFNDQGELIYVGKAIHLRRRLSQYRNAKRRKKHYKMKCIVSEAHRVETEVCAGELEALLLEAKLIRECRPKWNVAGAFHFLYPLIGIKSDAESLAFCYTTQPEKFADFQFYGAFRSRHITGEAFFSLVKLLAYVGHRTPTKKKSVVKYSYVFGFRRLPSAWLKGFDAFLRGESKAVFEELILNLVENSGARMRSRDTQLKLNSISRFWRHEIIPLKNALTAVKYGSFPLLQKDRDEVFLIKKFSSTQIGRSARRSCRERGKLF